MRREETPQWLNWEEEHVLPLTEKRNVHQYRYGIKDLQVRNKEYAAAAIYVTKPFDVEGNVMEISLSTDEEQIPPLVSGTGTAAWQTAIEYSVCFTDTPAQDDWIPILPTEQKTVEHEVLFFSGNRAELRFPRDINTPMQAYKNGVRMDAAEWTYDASNSVSIVSRFDINAIYTVSYSPDWKARDPWNVGIPASVRTPISYVGSDAVPGELFESGTDRNGRIRLSKYPFIDYARINALDAAYVPVHVQLEDAALSGPVKGVALTSVTESTAPVHTLNKTDYRTGIEPVLTAYDPTPLPNKTPTQPHIEYRQEGRDLYFTETFRDSDLPLNAGTNHGNAKIRVFYQYIKTACRLRIVLRNTTADKICTPRISKYTLTFRAMR